MKLYPKLAALDALADHLGIARPQRAEPADHDAGAEEAADISPHEAGRRIAFALRRAQRAKETDDTSDA